MSVSDFRYQRGAVHFPELSLWLDAHEPQSGDDRVFVSHAHSDHTATHREVILSEPTAHFFRARLGAPPIEHVLPFGQPRRFASREAEYEITLLPSGHILGSAMALIAAGNRRILYTGDFKLRAGSSAELCVPCAAEVLIMETTFGRPHYRFPPTAVVMQSIIRFCREALDNDETPVLFGYSLGKSQELLRGLAEADLPLMLHGQVYRLTRIYEALGQSFPPYNPYAAGTARGKVLVCPPQANQTAMLGRLGPIRTAILTGWAADPGCQYRYQVDAAFPLSDHADFPELLELVRQVNPKQIFTLHGFAADFAQTLRDLGYDAAALSEPDQPSLPLLRWDGPVRRRREVPTATPEPNEAGAALRENGAFPFAEFAATCVRISATTRKLEKVAILADYLKGLPPAGLGAAAVWFTGHPFAPSENRVLQLGWAIIRDAICAGRGTDPSEFGRVYLKHSDLGATAFEMIGPEQPSRHLDLAEVAELFRQLHEARGPTLKLPLLVAAFARMSAPEAKYLVKILTGDLRIGLKEGLVEEAIALAFAASLDQVKRANLLLGHIGATAVLALAGQLERADLQPFRPAKFMLASPVETAADGWERMMTPTASALPKAAGEGVWLEDKYDGIRCQLHKVGSRIELYSRDLKSISTTFADVIEAASRLQVDVILDGEILAMRGEQILPFAELQKRLGRLEPDLFLGEEIPAQFVAFDLLWLNGHSLLHEPLRARRQQLSALRLPRGVSLALVTEARTEMDIETVFAAARKRGNEGLMLKDPASVYSPGRRGLAWLSWK